MTSSPLTAAELRPCQLILMIALAASNAAGKTLKTLALRARGVSIGVRTCKGRANYLKLKEIHRAAQTALGGLDFDLKKLFHYLKIKITIVGA